MYTMSNGNIELGIYDKKKGLVNSVPLESYDPKLMGRGNYRGLGRPPSLRGVTEWTSPDLTPSKLAQRREVAEMLSGGTILELYGGKGHLSTNVWAKSDADKLIVLDKDAGFIKAAKKSLKGKIPHETVVSENTKWLKHMDPKQLKNLKVVDFDAFGSPTKQVKMFFDNYPIKKRMLICLTDGSNIFLAFHKNRKSAHTFLKKRYGIDFEPTGKREDQIKALDSLMQQQAQKHDFKVEPINVAFGKRQSVYAAYKISPKRNKN